MRRLGLVIVGDELLNGKRRDRHLEQVIEILRVRGQQLSWVRIAGDDHPVLLEMFRHTFASDDIVLSTGGIGATPDDCTREAAAAALGVPLELHSKGAAILRSKFGAGLNAQRLRMVDFPRGATLIPNPVNQVPGFSLRDHHFVPGFPRMAWPMLEWVMDTHYADLPRAVEQREYSYLALAPESELVGAMQAVLENYPGVKVSSLPSSERRGEVELSVRGPVNAVVEAAARLRAHLDAAGVEYSPLLRD